MNRIYKTIWNTATQSWTVAGELASAKGKSASKTVSTLAALSVVSVLGVSSAMAASTKTETAGANNENNIVTKQGRTVIIINNGKDVVTQSDGKDAPKNIIVIGSQDKHVYDEQILIGYQINSPGFPEHGKSAGKAGDVAIGNRITLGGSDSSGPDAKDSFSTVVGYGAQAVGPVVAMGVGARSDMLAFKGWNSVKEGVVAVGPFALAADNKNGTTAIGAISAANYNNSVAIGALSGAAHDWEDRGFGEQFNPNVKDEDKVKYQILEAGVSVATRDNLTSVGYKAAARGPEATAIGTGALTGTAGKRSGEKAIAVGTGAHAITDNTIAIGDNAHAGGLKSGQKTELETEIKRLEGLKKTAGDNLKKVEEMLKGNETAENKFRVASANAALERINLALERANQDKSRNNAHKDSNAQFAIAIGSNSLANNAKATAIGRFANARGENSNAIGFDAKVWGNNSNVLGANSKIEGDKENSTAIGSNNTVNSANVMVLGNNVIINNTGKTRDGAVVLGHESDGLLAENPVTSVASVTVNGVTYSGFKGNLSNLEEDKRDGRFVSIGSKDNERQIKHVAAGKISEDSTDAINGSQLYMVANQVGENKKDIDANKKGIDANKKGIADNKTAIDEIKGNITNINQTIANNHWNIADDKPNNTSEVKNGNTVTFKGENGVDVSLDSNTKTVTISGDSSNTPTVYTDKDGSKVVNNNGKFFKVDANGKPTTTEVKNDDVIVSVKNPNAGKDKAGAPTTITNVKDAKLTNNSKDAVNGSQLYKTNSDVKKNADSINNLTNQVNGNKDKIGELNQRINNINTNINNAVGDQVRNINKRIDGVENHVNHLDNKINNVDKRASRGIATAGAMGMLPQPHISGRSMVSAATTSYRGQQALAVGYSRLSDNGKHIIKFSGASNLAGKKDAMVGAAYGYQW